MTDMEERYSELPPEKAQRLAQVLADQKKEAFGVILDLDKRLTNTNFLTNGGGAIAVLAYFGASAPTLWLKVALALFTFGVCLTGIELRSLMLFYGELFKDVAKRHVGFIDNKMRVREAGVVTPNTGKRYKNMNHYSGFAAQACFVGGVVAGGIGFFGVGL